MAVLRDHLKATLDSKIKDEDGALSNYIAIYNDYTKRTVAEISAGVTPINYAYPPGDIRRYGAVLDGSTSDHAAFQMADDQSAAGGAPIFVPRSENGAATDTPLTVSHLSDLYFEHGAKFIYTGSSDVAVLTIGRTASNEVAFSRRFENMWVQRQSQSDWSSESNIGIVVHNSAGSFFSIVQINGFTIGFQANPHNGAGFQGNHLFFQHVYNCKIARDWTNTDGGFCNDNSIYAGRIQAFSSVNSLGARYGDRITSTDEGYINNNGNRFWGPMTELNASGTSSEAVAIIIEHGEENFFYNMRAEFNDLVLRCSNASQRNEVWLGYSDDAQTDIEQLDTASENSVLSKRTRPRTHYGHQVAYFSDLGRHARGTSGTSILIPGLTWASSGAATTAGVSGSSVTYDGNYITIPSTRGMGIYVDTSTDKEFIARRSGTAGGRLRVIAYDSGSSILSATGTVIGTAATPFTYSGASFGGSWGVGSDFLSDVYFRVSDDTDHVWVFIAGGTASAVVSSFGIYTRTKSEGVRAYTGVYTSPGEIIPAYTPTNVTTDRSFDANTVLIAELADVVGTLIADLQTLRILR